VEGLLDGKQMWIEPEGFEQTHRRGNEAAHRLQDPAKWIPYGVGAIEGTAGQPLDALEPGSNAQTPGIAEGGSPGGAASELRSPRLPEFTYAPGAEPRPAEGEPTGWSHGELL